jgi:hypothetical protein
MLRWIENSVTTETLTVRHRPERKDHEQLIRRLRTYRTRIGIQLGGRRTMRCGEAADIDPVGPALRTTSQIRSKVGGLLVLKNRATPDQAA